MSWASKGIILELEGALIEAEGDAVGGTNRSIIIAASRYDTASSVV